MATDIRAELQAVIDKSLPSLEAQRLRTYIAEAEKAKEDLVVSARDLGRVKESLAAEQQAKQVVLDQLSAAQAEIAAFRAREAAFKASEREVLIAQFRAEKAEAIREAVVEVVGQFTKNPEIRRTTWDNKSKPIYGVPSYQGAPPMQVGSETESHSGTETESAG